jgi:hypothetical protein
VHSAPVSFFSRVWPVKYRAHAPQRDSHPRSSTFRDFRTSSVEHRFDVSPDDIRSDRIVEYCFQCCAMFPIHRGAMISLYDTPVKREARVAELRGDKVR